MDLDVAIIGGGPAGISAAVEISRLKKFKIALFDIEAEPGGIPRSSHIPFFGLRDQKKVYTGRAYARRLNGLLRRTPVKIHNQATVLDIIPDAPGGVHRIDVLSPAGLDSYKSRVLLLATGCFERSRFARSIPGARPAGVFTAGALQEIVNLCYKKPGQRALIIGSEDIAFSSVLTLRRAGTSIVGMVEEDGELQTYPALAKAMSLVFRFPIYRGSLVKAIAGNKRVEGVVLVTNGGQEIKVECDTVVVAGKLEPYSMLLDNTVIEKDLSTCGPVVDMNLMTSIPRIFAAGNVLRGADMHDLCALEGKRVARNIVNRLESGETDAGERIPIQAEWPIRYVVPQKIIPSQIKSHRSSLLHPGIALQLGHTLKDPVLEAWSDDRLIWEHSYSRLIANTRVPVPIHKFDWSRVDNQKGIILSVRASKP